MQIKDAGECSKVHAALGVADERSLFQSKNEPEGSEGQANWKRLLSGLELSQISSRRRGGGNVEIGSFDFQGLWKSRRGVSP
jgi:hypothetical protein